MLKKVFIKTFGCQMNEYDSSKMQDILNKVHATSKTEDPKDADLIILNTCSVREKAEEKIYSHLGEYETLKKNNPNLLIAIGGCVASQEGQNILKRAPFVDLIFGPQTLHRLPDLLAKRKKAGISQVDISFPEIEKFDHLPIPTVSGSSAMVSIIEGCSKYCSFCVVPYTRGEEISRPLEDILAEVVHLTTLGVKEITLLGQNVNAYRSITKHGHPADLALLIEYISEIDTIERIKFTTSHPNEMTDNLIDCFGKFPKLATHLHLPIQSGSDRILTAMKRNYTVLEYKNIIKKLKKKCPDISISSDFIVGFPGETDADFELTKKIIQQIEFDFSYSFLYSPRPGTPASYIHDETPHEIKLKRLNELQFMNEAQGKTISHRMLGSIQRILIDGQSWKNPKEIAGKTDNNRVVDLKANKSFINQFVNVRITEVTSKRLRGEII
ncbi:MAG: tRNA (N6-isopentenyl adenosine(37)-C2)-methylthiotransferase MiaB [Candidatus Methylopumilus sp.]|nr:tRNA (N6-isopentenyl adenosine(37)-C2)-methylthiotransferase MiaB [Candidatus Methylopumilus sp.]